jgi:hypothetical protein
MINECYWQERSSRHGCAQPADEGQQLTRAVVSMAFVVGLLTHRRPYNQLSTVRRIAWPTPYRT